MGTPSVAGSMPGSRPVVTHQSIMVIVVAMMTVMIPPIAMVMTMPIAMVMTMAVMVICKSRECA